MPNLLISVLIVLAGLVFSLTYRGVRIDLEQKQIKQYVGFLGLKLGSWKPLPELKEVVFTSNSYSQQIHSIVSRRSLDTREFRAFIKSENHKILFSAGKNAQTVKQDAQTVAKKLSLPATDYTLKPPAVI